MENKEQILKDNKENAFYRDLWNLEEKEKDNKNLLKFQEEEKDIILFNQRYKEDLEQIDNTENPFIKVNCVICRDEKSTIQQKRKK